MLPLLQQFDVGPAGAKRSAEGGTSLTDDAAKAQAALAIRITKVKEEFMALIREFTQSKTFQLMAGTALSLASALIKIATAAKELLPILTALMAVKMARGMMGFVGGLKGGMKGGMPMMGMARGGLVPGSGNRDTVPAVLTPGEFVIRKQSVNAIGAGNLEGINRYASGGRVNLEPGAIGGFFLKPMKGQDRNKTLSGPGPSSNIVVTNKAVEQRLKTKGYTPTGAQVDDLVLARWVRSLPHDPSGRKVGTKRLGFSSGQDKREFKTLRPHYAETQRYGQTQKRNI